MGQAASSSFVWQLRVELLLAAQARCEFMGSDLLYSGVGATQGWALPSEHVRE